MRYRNFILICFLVTVALSGNTKHRSTVYDSVVTMNGHPINYDALSMNSRGVLAFVAGDPQSPKHKSMLFRVMLRRAGTAVQQWPDKRQNGIYSIQLDVIWPFVQLGDELVVEPVMNTTQGEFHKPGKRIFKLGIINLFTWNKC